MYGHYLDASKDTHRLAFAEHVILPVYLGAPYAFLMKFSYLSKKIYAVFLNLFSVIFF
jgi:hypothetical protein